MAETCRQRLMREHPEQVGPQFVEGYYGCPCDYGYLEIPDYCTGMEAECNKCWNRVIPETIEEKLAVIPEVEPDEFDLQMIAMVETEKEKKMTAKKTKAQLLEEIEELQAELKKVEKYRKYDEAAEEMKALYDSFVRAGFSEDQAFTICTTAMKKLKIE